MYSICITKPWDFVHRTISNYFINEKINFEFSYCPGQSDTLYAIYKINDDSIFSINVFKDNEFDFVLKFSSPGGDKTLMLTWYNELKQLLSGQIFSDIACKPGECNFDDLL